MSGVYTSKTTLKKAVICGYGSLNSSESASRTLSPETIATKSTVVLEDWKRDFNVFSGWYQSQYHSKKTDQGLMLVPQFCNIYLNIMPSVGDSVTLVTYECNSNSEIKAMIQREGLYVVIDIRPLLPKHLRADVPMLCSFAKTDATFSINGVEYRIPKQYMDAGREGAAEFGFLDEYDAQTEPFYDKVVNFEGGAY